jgi:hypothetical protein
VGQEGAGWRGQQEGAEHEGSSDEGEELGGPATEEEEEQSSSGDDSGYSDLEDFIVCDPSRDYEALIAARFRYSARE